MNKGVLMAVAFDEFNIKSFTENGQPKTKATIRVSFPGTYVKGENGQQGKREYCRLNCTTQASYIIDKLLAMGMPQGRQPQGQTGVFLTIPYKNLTWGMWTGNNGPQVTAYCDIDGDVYWTQQAPKTQNQQGGYQQGGQQQQQYQGNGGQQPQGGYQPQQQGGYQPPPAQVQQQFGNQGQQMPPQGGGYQPQQAQGGYQPPQQAFPAANPPGMGQPQPGFQPQQQGGYQPQQQGGYQPQQQGGGYQPQQAPQGGVAQPAAPFPTGQPFPQQGQQQGGFQPQPVAGSDPYTS